MVRRLRKDFALILFDLLAPFDFAILKFFNVTMVHPWLDRFWLTITQLHKLWWMRFIVFPPILGVFFWKYRAHAFKPLAVVALSVGLCDVITYRVIKAHVGRLRPFENPQISAWVRPVGRAHGSSFPSNHAANTFAAAGVLAWYFQRRRQWFYTLAILVGLSRVALGVHYPSDVVAGTIVGATCALFVNALVVSRAKWLWLPVSKPATISMNRPTSGRTFRT